MTKKNIWQNLQKISKSDLDLKLNDIVSVNKRFDQDEFYYSMSHPTYTDIFTKLYAALELQSLIGVMPITMSPSSSEKADFAFKNYSENMALSKKAIYGGVGSYNREKFEKEYGLKWQHY